MPEVIHSETNYELPFPPADVWPALRRTDWINRSVGLPAVQYEIAERPEGGTDVTARARVMGFRLEWEELPFEWLVNEFYRVRRIFANGPLTEAELGVNFHETSTGTTRLEVFSHLTPRHALGALIAKRVIIPKATRGMNAVIEHVGEYLAGRRKIVIPKLPVAPTKEEALEAGLRKLSEANQPGDLIGLLGLLLRESPDVELTHIRPLAVAKAWRRDPWVTLRFLLHSTRAGLLDLSWEVLCPNCRSSRTPAVTSLSLIERTSHCDVCAIKFDAEFDRSVELKFAVNPAVRARDAQCFCLAGPGGKPHVVSQLVLAPGQRRIWKAPPLDQAFRLRSPQVATPVTLQPDDAQPAPIFQPVIICKRDAFQVRYEYGRVSDWHMQVFNPNDFPMLLVLEQMEWSKDILTAAEVTNWQEFRDLFSGEIVSPNEQVTVGSQIVLFTDLRGSTAMYNGLGDGTAYSLVRNHFYVLTAAIREFHGAIVKTIGDAVMAVFSRVEEALAAVKQMHEKLPAANPNPSLSDRLILKSGLHLGPCLAVNANDKLDYFGTTINLAARLVDCSKGDDLTVSEEFFQRPETVRFIKEHKLTAEPGEVKFRGFEAAHKVWRIKMV